MSAGRGRAGAAGAAGWARRQQYQLGFSAIMKSFPFQRHQKYEIMKHMQRTERIFFLIKTLK